MVTVDATDQSGAYLSSCHESKFKDVCGSRCVTFNSFADSFLPITNNSINTSTAKNINIKFAKQKGQVIPQ